MKASELIDNIQQLMKITGDVDIVIEDYLLGDPDPKNVSNVLVGVSKKEKVIELIKGQRR